VCFFVYFIEMLRLVLGVGGGGGGGGGGGEGVRTTEGSIGNLHIWLGKFLLTVTILFIHAAN